MSLETVSVKVEVDWEESQAVPADFHASHEVKHELYTHEGLYNMSHEIKVEPDLPPPLEDNSDQDPFGTEGSEYAKDSSQAWGAPMSAGPTGTLPLPDDTLQQHCSIEPECVLVENKPHLCNICYKILDPESSLLSHSCGEHGESNAQGTVPSTHPADEKQQPTQTGSGAAPKPTVGPDSETLNRLLVNYEPYSCDSCQATFPLKSSLLTHTCSDKAVVCNICHKLFKDKASLKRHGILHTGEKPFSCEHCHKKFWRNSGLVEHMRVHTKNPFSCEICDKQFAHSSSLKTHYRIHAEGKPHGCQVCKKQFIHESILLNHMKIHAAEKPFSCDICNKRFNYKRSLDRHADTHTGAKTISCEICNKQFRDRYCLALHERIHSGEKPHSCQVCKKQFTLKSTLNHHMIVHTNEKPFSCDICQKRFRQSRSLVEHKLLHLGVKPHTCQVCEKKFTTKSNFNTHMRIHTRENPSYIVRRYNVRSVYGATDGGGVS